MIDHQQAISSRPVTVELASLVLDGSPRLQGEDESHVRLLAQATDELPPILVHRQTMRVLDGMHRVRAAKLRGQWSIRAVFFDGDADTAFVQAVVANVAHGLPLSLADRRAAAGRILRSHPGWSDRAIAAVAGLSPATVRSLRRRASAGRATDSTVQLPTRLGRDGRVRPLDASEGRRRAASLLAEQPEASLREIARAAGVAAATVRDVQRRIRNGEDPVPNRRRNGSRTVAGCETTGSEPVTTEPIARSTGTATRNGGPTAWPPPAMRPPDVVLAGLLSDPSLRYSDSGRALLRWLDAHMVTPVDWSRVSNAMPPHCALAIAEFAAACARAWTGIAEDLMTELNSDGAYDPLMARPSPRSGTVHAVEHEGG